MNSSSLPNTLGGLRSSPKFQTIRSVKDELRQFCAETRDDGPDAFSKKYNALLKSLQDALGQMAETPIVSLAHQAVAEQCRLDEGLV